VNLHRLLSEKSCSGRSTRLFAEIIKPFPLSVANFIHTNTHALSHIHTRTHNWKSRMNEQITFSSSICKVYTMKHQIHSTYPSSPSLTHHLPPSLLPPIRPPSADTLPPIFLFSLSLYQLHKRKWPHNSGTLHLRHLPSILSLEVNPRRSHIRCISKCIVG